MLGFTNPGVLNVYFKKDIMKNKVHQIGVVRRVNSDFYIAYGRINGFDKERSSTDKAEAAELLKRDIRDAYGPDVIIRLTDFTDGK